MEIGAIITGDIVKSTILTSDERKALLCTLNSIPALLSPLVNVKMEIFRGDSFQISVSPVELSLRVALIIRSYLRSCDIVSGKQPLDARIALGIGTIDYQSDTLATSDGEAFRLSGRTLDDIGKSRLKIATSWTCFNDEFDLLTAFADDIVSSWTKTQSKIILSSLISSKSRDEIAEEMGVSRQTIDKSLRTSKEDLMVKYITRFEKLINENIEEKC